LKESCFFVNEASRLGIARLRLCGGFTNPNDGLRVFLYCLEIKGRARNGDLAPTASAVQQGADLDQLGRDEPGRTPIVVP
jgi:hypothetical protein